MKNGLIINRGNKFWYKDGLFHRIDGPAVELANGHKEWYKEDNLHREDGPAVESHNGDKAWYYEDKYVKCSSQEEFVRLLNLKLFW